MASQYIERSDLRGCYSDEALGVGVGVGDVMDVRVQLSYGTCSTNSLSSDLACVKDSRQTAGAAIDNRTLTPRS